MKKISYNLLILLSFLFISFSTSARAPLPDISAEGAILIEANTGTILYAKNINSVFYPASTTKVLTCLLLSEGYNPDQIISKTSSSIANVPSDSSHIGLAVGDSYTLYNGLHGILMSSDNFISYDMAVNNAGSIEYFANKMNEKARSLGARSSHFVNPHGYHDPNHYTTPYDLSLITRAAFANSTVSEIAGTSEYPFKVANKDTTIPLTHTAALFDKVSSYYNPHVVAAKTGYHTPAGRTLVAKAVYDNIELIGVVMKTNTPYQFEDMNDLFEYGSENFKLIGDSTTGRRIENISYAPWSQPYVEYALEQRWIEPTIQNYQAPVTKRTFLHLLKNALPSDYVPSWELESVSTVSPSLLNEPINGLEATQLLNELASDIIPLSWFDIVESLNVQALSSDSHLTLEQTLCITYKLKHLLQLSAPYIFHTTY